jgi:hypothetical protein
VCVVCTSVCLCEKKGGGGHFLDMMTRNPFCFVHITHIITRSRSMSDEGLVATSFKNPVELSRRAFGLIACTPHPTPHTPHSTLCCRGDWKLLLGSVNEAGWTGWIYPNASTAAGARIDPPHGARCMHAVCARSVCSREYYVWLDC